MPEREAPRPFGAINLGISEAEFQQTVMDTAMLLQWHITHFRPARVSEARWATALSGHPGLPDLILARKGKVLLVELKTMKGKTSDHQKGWLAALGEYGRLWTPAEWNDGTIERDLR